MERHHVPRKNAVRFKLSNHLRPFSQPRNERVPERSGKLLLQLGNFYIESLCLCKEAVELVLVGQQWTLLQQVLQISISSDAPLSRQIHQRSIWHTHVRGRLVPGPKGAQSIVHPPNFVRVPVATLRFAQKLVALWLLFVMQNKGIRESMIPIESLPPVLVLVKHGGRHVIEILVKSFPFNSLIIIYHKNLTLYIYILCVHFTSLRLFPIWQFFWNTNWTIVLNRLWHHYYEIFILYLYTSL